MLLQTIFITNDLSAGAARYMSVKDGVHARRAAFMAMVLNILLPLLLFIPPLTAVVLFPDLASRFPTLKHPSEGAFVAVCMKTMPHGLLGLMVSGIFAAAMAGMDVSLNRNTGIFVKNFYQRVLRPGASESELLKISRVVTMFFGVVIIGGGLLIAPLPKCKLVRPRVNDWGSNRRTARRSAGLGALYEKYPAVVSLEHGSDRLFNRSHRTMAHRTKPLPLDYWRPHE